MHNPKFPNAAVTVAAGTMTVVEENTEPTDPKPAPPEKIKEYEKETTPATASSSQSASQKELLRFIGCK